MKYYTLVEWQTGRWIAIFGDYDRETVRQELLDQANSSNRPRHYYKVITSSETEAEIDAAIAALPPHD